LFVDFGYRKKFVLARTIASYTEKNMNSKIGVQGAMLISTNKMITMRRLRMTSTKRSKKGRMPLLVRTLKGLKREKFLLL
jgi:hypothetical protein